MSTKVNELPDASREAPTISDVVEAQEVNKLNDCTTIESKADAEEAVEVVKKETGKEEPEVIVDSTPEPVSVKSEEPEEEPAPVDTTPKSAKVKSASGIVTETSTVPFIFPFYYSVVTVGVEPDEKTPMGDVELELSINPSIPTNVNVKARYGDVTDEFYVGVKRKGESWELKDFRPDKALGDSRWGEISRAIRAAHPKTESGCDVNRQNVQKHLVSLIERKVGTFLRENHGVITAKPASAPAPKASKPAPAKPTPIDTASQKDMQAELAEKILTSIIPSHTVTVSISIDGQAVPQDFMFSTQTIDREGKIRHHRMNIEYIFTDTEGKDILFSNGSYFINSSGLYPLKLPCDIGDLMNGESFVASVEALASARFGEVTDEGKAKAKAAIIEAVRTAFTEFMTKNVQELVTTHQLIERYKSGTDASDRDTSEKYFSINGLRFMIPFPYVNKSNIIYHRKIKIVDGEDGEVEEDIIDTYICNGVAVTGRGKFPDGRDCYVISVHAGLGKWIEHNIEAWRLRNRIELKKVVAECGIKLSERHKNYDMFMEFLDTIEEVESIAEYEGDTDFRIPTFESTKQAGWNEDCTAFVNADKTISLTGKNIRLFREDKPNQKRQHVHASGTKEEWARGTKGMHECKVTRFKCYGHISAPLLKPVGLSSYTLNNGGGAGTGKSIGASFSRSLSGDPEGLHFGGYATINSLEDYYKDMNDLATDGDELASKNRKMNEVADIIFMVSGEEGKGRKTEERTKHATVYITSIEKDIFTKSSNDGEFRRAIDVRDKITLSKDAIKAYVDTVLKGRNYGHILEPFILKVMEMHHSGELMTLYDACLMHFPPSENGVKGTIYRYLALIATSGIIYECILKELGLTTKTLGENGIRSLTDKEVLELVSEIGESYMSRIPEPIYMRALCAIWDVFYGKKQMYLNRPESQSSEFGEFEPNARVIEGHETKTELLITRTSLDDFLGHNGYPPGQCLLDFKENKFIKTGAGKSDGYTMVRTAFKGRFVVFDKIKISNKVIGGVFDEVKSPFEPPKPFTFPESKKSDSVSATEQVETPATEQQVKSPESELEATQLQVIKELDEGLATLTHTIKDSEVQSA